MADQETDKETTEEDSKPGKPIIDEPTEPALNPEDDEFDKSAT